MKQARKLADQVRGLLRELGDSEEHRSLNQRFRRTQRRLHSGIADEAAGYTFAELSLAVHRLNLLAHEKFYTKKDAS